MPDPSPSNETRPKTPNLFLKSQFTTRRGRTTHFLSRDPKAPRKKPKSPSHESRAGLFFYKTMFGSIGKFSQNQVRTASHCPRSINFQQFIQLKSVLTLTIFGSNPVVRFRSRLLIKVVFW